MKKPKESYVILTSFIDTTKEAEIYCGDCAVDYAKATLMADRKHVVSVAVYDGDGLVMKLINKEHTSPSKALGGSERASALLKD